MDVRTDKEIEINCVYLKKLKWDVYFIDMLWLYHGLSGDLLRRFFLVEVSTILIILEALSSGRTEREI
jgi:hypothetical protein